MRLFVPISMPETMETVTCVHCLQRLTHHCVFSRCQGPQHPVSRAWIVLMSLAILRESLSPSKIANDATGATEVGPSRHQTILPELSRLKT